jgi:hypothetical protein
MVINVDAELITEDTRIAGVLTSISADCVCIETFPGEVAVDLSEGNLFHVEFQTESGEKLLLFCSVIWSKKISSEAGPVTTCLKLEETSPEFETYFKAIFSRDEGIV